LSAQYAPQHQFAKEMEAASDGNSLINKFELPMWHKVAKLIDARSLQPFFGGTNLHWTATDPPNIVASSEIAGSSECTTITFTSNVAN